MKNILQTVNFCNNRLPCKYAQITFQNVDRLLALELSLDLPSNVSSLLHYIHFAPFPNVSVRTPN